MNALDREITLDSFDWVRIKDEKGGMLKEQSVQCILLLAILDELQAQRKLLEKLVERSTLL